MTDQQPIQPAPILTREALLKAAKVYKRNRFKSILSMIEYAAYLVIMLAPLGLFLLFNDFFEKGIANFLALAISITGQTTTQSIVLMMTFAGTALPIYFAGSRWVSRQKYEDQIESDQQYRYMTLMALAEAQTVLDRIPEDVAKAALASIMLPPPRIPKQFEHVLPTQWAMEKILSRKPTQTD